MLQSIRWATLLVLSAAAWGAEEEEDFTGRLAVSACYQGCFDTWLDRELDTTFFVTWRERYRWCADTVETQFVIEQCADHYRMVETAHDTQSGTVRTRYVQASSARRAILEGAGLLPVPDEGFGEAHGGWSDACDAALYTTSPEGWSVYTGLPEMVRAAVFRSDPDFQ